MKILVRVLPILLLFSIADPGDAASQSADSTDQHQSLSQMLERAHDLHMSGEEQQALAIYRNVLDEDSDNLEALWNSSVIYAKVGHRKESDEEKREEFEESMELAERAVNNHPQSGHAYYAMAVANGRMTEVMGAGDKIDASRKIKQNIEKASELLPDFAPIWHLYGVWHSDVANMSGAVKAAAGLFSGGIPDASNEKAEEYLRKAISLDEDNILFHLDLAKHYLEVDRPEDARSLLKEIQTMEPQMKDDPMYIDDAEKLLDELGE